MRYDPDEALRLTLQRAALLRERRRKRQRAALSFGACGCACALLGFCYALAATGGVFLAEANFGAFLLPSKAGGYILAGVLAFAAGVVVTMLCLRYRNSAAAEPFDPQGRKKDPGGGTSEGGADSRAAQQEGPDQTKNSMS